MGWMMTTGRAGLVAACLFVTLHAADASAQLTPDKTYYGVDRAMPFTVQVPEEADGEVRITLHAWGETEPLAEAAAEAGAVNLASLLPTLWEDEDPRVLYAQLRVGTQAIGSPVVLQPMTAVRTARLGANQRVSFPPAPSQARAYSGLIAYPARDLVLETSEGTIRFRFRPDEAPNTVRHIMNLAAGGFYNDIIFHRIVNNNRGTPFVIQVGDPLGEGIGGPGFQVDLEPSTLPHDFGVLSMARSTDPDSGGSQFFVALSREGTSFLDGQYTSFGEAVSGADVIVAIAASPVEGPQNRPVDPAPVLESARLVPAPPFGEGPDPVTRPEAPATPR